MAEARYTLMRDEFSYVHAHMYGSTRTATTILAALTAIGGSQTTLVLSPHSSGAEWQLDVPLTIPANVTLLIPAGVYLTGSNNLLILGNVLAWRSDWFQGTGTLNVESAALPVLSAFMTTGHLRLLRGGMAVAQRAPSTGTPWTLTWPSTPGSAGQVLQTSGGGMSLWQDAAATLPEDSITYAHIQPLSASNRLLGRSSPGAGNIEEIVCTAAGRALLDDTDSAAQRLTLGIPAGSDGQVQYHAAVGLGGSSGLTLSSTQVTGITFGNPGAARTALGLGSMAVQQANNVAISNGQISLGGHSTTAPLDVQTLLSDTANPTLALGLRLWPVAPAGTTATCGVRIEAMTGAQSTTSTMRGVQVQDQPAGTSGIISAFHSMISAGTNRYGIFADGTAQHFVNGPLGIKVLTPSYDLDIAGIGHVSNGLLIGGKTPQMSSLDVQTVFLAADLGGTTYCGVRLWPYAPTGATATVPWRIDAGEGANIASSNILGLQVSDQPTTTGSVYGVHLLVNSGTNRYNIFAAGTALNAFAGPVQLVGFLPSQHKLIIEYERATASALLIRPNADTGVGSAVLFRNAADTAVGQIYTSATTTTYATSSDRRLKRNVTPLGQALETVAQLRPVSFFWNVNNAADQGFLADELQQVVPHAVVGQPDAINLDGSIRPQAVDYGKLVPLLTAALQEVLARVEALEGAIL